MKKMVVVSLILVSIFLLVFGFQVNARQLQEGESITSDYPRFNHLIGSRISVAVTNGVDEQDPAVAECGGISLVVYERDGAIWGRRLSSTGELLSTFEIYDGTYAASLPDVACLWPGIFEQYFVVVWTVDWDNQHNDFDVYAQALHLNGDLISGYTYVAASTDNEYNPAIACEGDSVNCLVLFEYEGSTFHDLEGQRLYMDTATTPFLDTDGDVFDPGSAPGDDAEPALAWSLTQEEYLAAWEAWYDDPVTDHTRIKVALIYEHEQGASMPEVKSGPEWLIDPDTGLDYDQKYPAAASNNVSGYYMVTFTEWLSTSSVGYGVLLDGLSTVVYPFYLEADAMTVYKTSVAFMGGTTGMYNVVDEFLAVNAEYQPDDRRIEGTTVYESEYMDENIGFESVTSPVAVYDPDVTGSPVTKTYLIVWEELNSSGDYDIYAQRYGNDLYYHVFLPLILK